MMKGLQMDATKINTEGMIAKAEKDWEAILRKHGEFVFRAAYITQYDEEPVDTQMYEDFMAFFRTGVIPKYVREYLADNFYMAIAYVNPHPIQTEAEILSYVRQVINKAQTRSKIRIVK